VSLSHDDMRTALAGMTVCYASTEGYGGVWRTVKQARTLADAGARVVVAGYEGLVPAALMAPPFESRIVETPFRASSNPVRIVRAAVNLTVVKRSNEQITAPRSASVLRRRQQPLVDAIASTGAQVVQAVDLPALDVAYEAARRLGAKLIYASHELWTGFVENRDLALSPELAAVLLENERRLIRDADLVTVTSDQMGQRLVQQYGISAPLTLYNAPPERVEVAGPVSDPVRLVYHGGLSTDRNLDGLIRAMLLIEGRATLDIHGFDRTTNRGELEALIGELGLTDRVRTHGGFDYADVVTLLEGYDIGVMAAKVVEENFAVTLPNKIFDCMCAGIAVALNESESVNAVLADVPFGILLDPSTPETIARDLGALVADPERIMAMKRAAVAASDRYWWPEQGRKLLEAVTEITGRST